MKNTSCCFVPLLAALVLPGSAAGSASGCREVRVAARAGDRDERLVRRQEPRASRIERVAECRAEAREVLVLRYRLEPEGTVCFSRFERGRARGARPARWTEWRDLAGRCTPDSSGRDSHLDPRAPEEALDPADDGHVGDSERPRSGGTSDSSGERDPHLDPPPSEGGSDEGG
ncbi:MAG: hypothetical protein NDJ89_11790 [Oligoflexia bacterium]|nr:hypothetical protein [Oligoflexia bacterium]